MAAKASTVAGDATPSVLTRRHRARAARHESEELPTTGSPWPSRGRGRRSAHRRVDGPRLGQVRVKATQNSRSRVWRCGRLIVRFIAVSCCRSAKFSKTNSRCPRTASASARPVTISSTIMRRSWLASARKSTRTSSGGRQPRTIRAACLVRQAFAVRDYSRQRVRGSRSVVSLAIATLPES
jgi:hypothetical protein